MIARYCDFSQITSGELDKIGIFVLADSCVAVFVVAWRGVACYNCTIMRFGVSRKTLMVVAGIVWTVAGVNILRIGIDCWVQVSGGFVLMLLGRLRCSRRSTIWFSAGCFISTSVGFRKKATPIA